MPPDSLPFDQQAEQMLGRSLRAKRLAFVLAKTASLHTLVPDMVSIEQPAESPEGETSTVMEKLRRDYETTIVFGFQEFCARPARRRRPHAELPDPFKQILERLVASTSPIKLLEKAYGEPDRLLTDCVTKVRGLERAYYRHKQSPRDNAFDVLARTLGYSIEAPSTVSLKQAIKDTEEALVYLDDNVWSQPLRDKISAALVKVEPILHALVSFYSRAVPEATADWKTMASVSGALSDLPRIWGAEEAIAQAHGHLYRTLFGVTHCVIKREHEKHLDAIRFGRNAIIHPPPNRLSTQTLKNILDLRGHVDAVDQEVLQGLAPIDGKITLAPSELVAIGRLACRLALDWYYALENDQRFPEIQLHITWDTHENLLTYRDEQGQRKSVNVSQASPFLGQEVFVRRLSGGKIIWISVEESNERVLVQEHAGG